MNPSCNSCPDEQLWNLLQADDFEDTTGDRQKATASANHLAECPHCQSRLEQLAAEPAQWLDIRDSLQPDQELDADKSSQIDKLNRDKTRWGASVGSVPTRGLNRWPSRCYRRPVIPRCWDASVATMSNA